MRRARALVTLAMLAWTATVLTVSAQRQPAQVVPGGPAAPPGILFETSDNCLACHNGLRTAAGEDISIGLSWRGSMMANSSRDPYWHAAVRREILDHPEHAQEIEQECSVCHMPMAHTQAAAEGRRTELFANLFRGNGRDTALAADGVGCTLCHQVRPDRFGTRDSFNGGFVIDAAAGSEARPAFGPFAVDAGRSALMQSATGFVPAEGVHVRQSELCATCHTLFTKALDADGKIAGELPEQVPYLEWRHSAYRLERSCQDCHMPVIDEPVAVSSVLGQSRTGVARHSFRGGNFFMLRMLNAHRAELGVIATPGELDAAANETVRFLQHETATVAIENLRAGAGAVSFDVAVANLSGHKFPTAYPSRRAWLHVTVRDAGGKVLFESGRIHPNGAIEGNDNDLEGSRFEPHHTEIRTPQDVQIYESVMVDHRGTVTTGLLSGVKYVKDNRLLPKGFDKSTAPDDVAVQGTARHDENFTAGADRVRYAVPAPDGPLTVEAVLRYQPIGFRWAANLEAFDAPEPRRFVNYYRAAAGRSSEVIARTMISTR